MNKINAKSTWKLGLEAENSELFSTFQICSSRSHIKFKTKATKATFPTGFGPYIALLPLSSIAQKLRGACELRQWDLPIINFMLWNKENWKYQRKPNKDER